MVVSAALQPPAREHQIMPEVVVGSERSDSRGSREL